MKKILCILISLSLMIGSSVFTFAKGPKKQDNTDRKKTGYTTQINQFNDEEKDLKDQIRKAGKDTKKMKQLLKKMQDLRKKYNKHKTMIIMDGEEIESDVAPVIKSGRTLVPIKAIANGLKADVKWDPETKTVTVTKAVYSEVYGVQNNVIEIKLGSDIIKVNGTEIKNDAPAEINNNRTVVPIRLIAELLKLKVEWDPNSGSVIIQKTETYVVSPTVQTPAPTATATPVPTIKPVPTTTASPETTPTAAGTPTDAPTATPVPTEATATASPT